MESFPVNYRVLVIGATGAIGSAFVEVLNEDARCGQIVALGRRTTPLLDLTDSQSIAAAAQAFADEPAFHLVILATGVLHSDGFMPEKSLKSLSEQQLLTTFQINTFGPALILQHFLPLLDRDGIFAVLSAKVGSIEDNRLGGWYSYRASKAALNMIIKTAAIESARRWPGKRLVALHPGTVTSRLSRPFRPEARPPREAISDMLAVLDKISTSDNGGFFSYQGERLSW
jgi:NAD(P)-dependent dehydrogenase (short-subunit alcohol dehydrogenase family)